MAYKIVYGEVKQPVKKDISLWILTVFVAILLSCAISPELRAKVFPWTNEYAVEAYSDFRLDLQEGTTFEDAFLAYCRDIIAYDMEES